MTEIVMERSGLVFSPSSSYDVSDFSHRSRVEHEERIARIVVEQWTEFALVKKAERSHQMVLKRKALVGFLRNKSEGRALWRLSLVHYASFLYGKYLSQAFLEWRQHTVGERTIRNSFLAVLARRAIYYMRKSFAEWQRWTREQKEEKLLLAFEAWVEKAKALSTSELEIVNRFKSRRGKVVLVKWKEQAKEAVRFRAQCDLLQRSRSKSVLRRWSERARVKAEGNVHRTKKHLALKLWQVLAKRKASRRSKFEGLALLWRRRQCERAFGAWKGVFLEAKDWEMQKKVATTHYLNTISRIYLREWRRFCEVIAWVAMKEAHKTRLNMHKMLLEWRQISQRANDLEKRRRLVVAHSYISRLRKCFQVLVIYREAMRTNVEAVLEVYATIEKQSILKKFRAWKNEFLPIRKRKAQMKEKSIQFAKTFALSMFFHAWIDVNSLNLLGRKLKETISSKKCLRAFHVWHRSYVNLKAKQTADDERGRRLERILQGKLLSRLLEAWQRYANLKSAKELTLSLAIHRLHQRVLRDCIQRAWVPFVKYCRIKKAKIAKAEELRQRKLMSLCVTSMKEHVFRSRKKRDLLLSASKHYLSQVLKKSYNQWTQWLLECKKMKEEENEALQNFWKASASSGIQRWMQTGFRRHRSRMHALAEVNAQVTKRKMELIEPIARHWRQKARRSSSTSHNFRPRSLFNESELQQKASLISGSAANLGTALGSSDHRELFEDAQLALEKFSTLLESEKKDNSSLREFMSRKSRDRRQPRRPTS